MADCKTMSESLEALADGLLGPAEGAAVKEHLTVCDSCASAWQALETLQAHRSTPAPAPRPELFSEILRAATEANSIERESGVSRFWLGAGLGGAIAAGIVFALLSFSPILQERTLSTPQLTIALNETRDVNVAIDSPQDLRDAQIRVVLTGAVALAGFEGQSEVRWSTHLDRGVNMLSLPVTMQGLDGGRLLVEVDDEDHHEIFVVELQSSAEAGASMRPQETYTEGSESQV